MSDKSAEIPSEEIRQRWVAGNRPPLEKAMIGTVKASTKLTGKVLKFSWRARLFHSLALVGISASTGWYTGSQKNLEDYRQDLAAGAGKVKNVLTIDHKMPSEVAFDQLSSQERSISNFDIIYPWLHESEKLEAISQVNQARQDLDNNYPSDVVDKVKVHEPVIRLIAEEYQIPEELFKAQVLVESAGDPLAYNSVSGAKGLTQVTDVVARKYAQQFNFKITGGEEDPEFLEDGRFNAEIALMIAASELRESHSVTNLWPKDFQKYHLGAGNYEFLEAKAFASKGVDFPSIIITPKNDSAKALAEATAEAMTNQEVQKFLDFRYEMSPFRIFKVKEVWEIIQDPSWDSTHKYLPRILAAVDKYYQEK